MRSRGSKCSHARLQFLRHFRAQWFELIHSVDVELNEATPLGRYITLMEDRFHWALRYAGSAVDAVVGIDVPEVEKK